MEIYITILQSLDNFGFRTWVQAHNNYVCMHSSSLGQNVINIGYA